MDAPKNPSKSRRDVIKMAAAAVGLAVAPSILRGQTANATPDEPFLEPLPHEEGVWRKIEPFTRLGEEAERILESEYKDVVVFNPVTGDLNVLDKVGAEGTSVGGFSPSSSSSSIRDLGVFSQGGGAVTFTYIFEDTQTHVIRIFKREDGSMGIDESGSRAGLPVLPP
ncbi:MAG: twin-arginine translocation signal domain-containing protein [Minisyncoccia bacterium]